MNAKSIILLFCSVFILSCKNDKAESTQDATKNEVKEKSFKVTLSVISKENDTFSMYYTEDGSINFSGKPITVDLGGMSTPQPIVYNLPEGAFPTELRLDFGMNKDQGEIILQSVEMEYNGNKRIIAGAEIGSFFRADDSKCTFNPGTGAIVAKEVNGVRQFPSLYPQEANLKPELEKLAK